jgi:AcrR family transcriptional regulator
VFRQGETWAIRLGGEVTSMQPSRPPDEPRGAVPAEIRARVMPAVIDELARWGVERFSIEAMAERHHLDAALIYRYWGDRRRLIVDAAIEDVETLSSLADTGSLRGDLFALARAVTDRVNTEVGRTLLRAVVMNRRGRHDEDTRLMFWGRVSTWCARWWIGPGSAASCAMA